ncbi:MAG: tyrosine-type recombinase/integrase [Sphingomonadaceae bacterium]|jgi:hypothetical protein
MLPDAPKPDPAETSKFRVIKIKKGLAVYKQSRSPFWYVRCYMPFGGRYNQVISTKTDSEREARKIAEDFYIECAVKKRALGGDLPSGSKAAKDLRYSFSAVADEFLEDRKRYAGTNPKHLRNYHDMRKLIHAKNGLKAFFAKRDISTIVTADVRDYMVFAEEQSLKGALSASTRSKHLITLNLVMKSAYEKGLIATLPLMPKQRVVDNPRPWFDNKEYRRLWAKALRISKNAEKAGDHDKAKRFAEVHDFIVFMVNTFLRPSEWANLRHRHIKVHSSGETPHLEITVSDGKTKPRVVYSMPTAVEVYQRMKKRTGQERDNYLFKTQYFNRKTALSKMRLDFETVLKAADLETDGFGKKRTMYSLRHSAIMFRLLMGDNVDYQTLVKNAGTSIDQLHRFYASHLDPRMNLGNLQSFKAKG